VATHRQSSPATSGDAGGSSQNLEARLHFEWYYLVREQAGTLHGHAISEANEGAGRFTAQSRVGATAAPAPVAAPNWAHDPSGPEPPLGVDINALEPTGTPTEIAQSLIDNSELEPGAAARTFAGCG
jgi:hypothetical protein